MDLKYDLGNGVTLVLFFSEHWFRWERSLEMMHFEKDDVHYSPRNPDGDDELFTPALTFVPDAIGHLAVDISGLLDYKYYTYLDGSKKVDIALPEFSARKIRFDTYSRKSMAEIREQQQRGDHICSDEFILAAIRDGIHNIRIKAPCSVRCAGWSGIYMTIPDDKDDAYECCIDESKFQRDLLTGYKIDLQPVNQEVDIDCAGSCLITGRDYYVMDLMSLLHRSSDFEILPSIGDQSWDHTREYFEGHGILI